MWPYLAVGILIAIAAMLPARNNKSLAVHSLYFVILTVFVGLRHHVGMDWNNYLRMIHEAGTLTSLNDLEQVSEWLYALFLVVGNETSFGIYGVNLFTTIVFLIGLFAFLRRTPEPMLGLMAAMPILIMVVAMSANRQAMAIGMMLGLVAYWNRVGIVARSLFVILTSGIHASALIFLGFIGLEMRIRPAFKIVGGIMFALLMVYILQQTGRADYYDAAYGSGRRETTESSGAFFHVALNAIPAAFYFLMPSKRAILFPTQMLKLMAFAALATVPLVLVSSAAAGRISLYWFPVSLWFWAALPQVFQIKLRPIIRLSICALMLSQIYIWLAYGNAALAHIPYSNALFVDPWELEIGVLP